MRNIIKTTLLFTLLSVLAVGCKQDELMNFGGNDLIPRIDAVRFPGVYTENNTMPGYNDVTKLFIRDYSFASDPGTTVKVYDLPVVIEGAKTNVDRKVNVDVTFNNAPDGFEILEAVVPANKAVGYIRVKVTFAERHLNDRDTVKLTILSSPDLQQGSKDYLNAVFTWSKLIPAIPNKTFYPQTYNLLINSPLTATNSTLAAYSVNAHLAILNALGWPIGFWGGYNTGYDPFNFMTFLNGMYMDQYYQQRLKKYLDDYKAANGDYLRHNAGSQVGIAIQARVWKDPNSPRQWVTYDPNL